MHGERRSDFPVTKGSIESREGDIKRPPRLAMIAIVPSRSLGMANPNQTLTPLTGGVFFFKTFDAGGCVRAEAPDVEQSTSASAAALLAQFNPALAPSPSRCLISELKVRSG
jgi:hypothetical protein